MAETRCSAIIDEEEIEVDDDDIYENIEAPKFVDLTAPDSRRPDDDRHWFCFRVGCDQKHEQESDSEAIYKNFVLRVMAARSPNVRLRKALNRREASAKLKCPLTAPAKSRVSRMDLISSLSHKMTDNNVKVKPLSKVAATPKAKVKQSPSVAKALTTPRNHQKKVSNVEQLRSVQSKKALAVGVPKSGVVAKALVFHSPKKVLKIKSSIELKTAMRTLCSAMNKLELNGVKKNGEGGSNSLAVVTSKKQLRGREVKSRVFDSLYSNNLKEPETNTKTSLKEKKIKKGKQICPVAVPLENDTSDMEIDEKSRCGSLEGCHESGTSGSGGELSLGDEKSHKSTRGESSDPVLTEASRSDITSLSSLNNEENKNTERNENEETKNSVSNKGKVSVAKKRKAEENSLASDDKENERQLTENDDKENVSSPHENIEKSNNDDVPKKEAILGSKHSRKAQKKSTSTSTTPQVLKYRKLKPTNPKPFKLRTDERRILKEANSDRKIPSSLKETTVKGSETKAIRRKYQNANRTSETCSTKSEQDPDNYYSSCDEKSNQTTQENQSERRILKEANLDRKIPSSLKETTVKGSESKAIRRKYQNANRTSETCSTNSEQDPDNYYSSCDEKSNQTTQENQSGSIKSNNSNCKVQRKLSATTPLRNPPGPKLQKVTDLNDNFKRKSQMMQRKIVRPRSALPRKKEKVVLATKLSVIMEKPSDIVKSKETKPRKNDAASSPTSKTTGSIHRPFSRGRRDLTVPKEPRFQSLHVPKDCTTGKHT